MAGGYITEDGFVEDETQNTTPQELSLESVCGGVTVLPAGNIETVVEKTTPTNKGA